jgi:hypothetical protein
LERTLHCEEADFLRSLDGVTERAYHIGVHEILGDWKLLNAPTDNPAEAKAGQKAVAMR